MNNRQTKTVERRKIQLENRGLLRTTYKLLPSDVPRVFGLECDDFGRVLTHISECARRAGDLAVSICAILLAEACNNAVRTAHALIARRLCSVRGGGVAAWN
jgi:hypothetical protein